MKVSGKVLLFTTVTAVALAMTCMGFGQDSRPSFSISISAPSSVKVGSSARVDISLINKSNRTIVLSRGDNTEAEINFCFNIDVRNSEGKSAPLRTEAWPLSGKMLYIDVKPGEKLKAGADIGKLFDLKPGAYSIQLSRTDNNGDDRVPVAPRGSADLPPPGTVWPAQSQPVAPVGPIIKSNTVTVTVIP